MHPVLQVKNLRISAEARIGRVAIVEGISFSVMPGRTLAIVGESGCGKSVTALSLLQILPAPLRVDDGQAIFGGRGGKDSIDLFRAGPGQMRSIRGAEAAIVFQEPTSSLHPLMTIGEQIVEAIQAHENVRKSEARRRAIELLARVGIDFPQRRAAEFPHQFSGGMAQRAMIAMAVACGPQLLIADEPATALDATVSRQVMDLIRDLQRETGLALILITHDLGLARRYADDAAVMYCGKIVEIGPADQVLSGARHPYTKGLLCSAPRARPGRPSKLEPIMGAIPGLLDRPTGCRFHPRCALTAERSASLAAEGRATMELGAATVLLRCVAGEGQSGDSSPPLRAVSPGHEAACWEV